MPEPTSPIRPMDDDARSLARQLMAEARHAALALIAPDSGQPIISRIAFGLSPEGQPMSLVSTLARHTRALSEDAAAALLIGEPGAKGDPLTHPRLSLQARAKRIARNTPEHEVLRAHYLQTHPKAALYVDFADFGFVLFTVTEASLNGGFGKAYDLTPADLGLA